MLGGGLDQYRCKGRVWIEGKDGTFLGYGRVVLLERVREYGSISKAAKSMQMSYKHAWDLIRSMNSQSALPLVETSTGGKGGGGTKVTESGEKAIAVFWQLYEETKSFFEDKSKTISF